MNFFKSIIANQWNRFKSVREGHELYFIFFRLCQICALVGTIQAFFLFSRLSLASLDMFSNGFSAKIYGFAALNCFFWTLSAELGLRRMDRAKLSGIYIGLILSFCYTFSLAFPLGIFGLYAFLNSSAQKKFLGDAPPWLREILTTCKINYIESENSLTEPSEVGKNEVTGMDSVSKPERQ